MEPAASPTRQRCTCASRQRRTAEHVSCPACAAWDRGVVLFEGGQTLPRWQWQARHQPEPSATPEEA